MRLGTLLDELTFEVRPATDRDTQQIGRFLAEFRSTAPRRRGARDYFDFSHLVAHSSESESSEDSLVLLCLQGTDLLGIGALRFGPREAVTRASLELFCSDENRHATEVLQLLIETAEVKALSKDIHEVDVMSLPGDQPLKSSLEERGYRARLLIMHRTI